MEYMTNQQVFDKVLEHSRQMTEQCYSEDKGGCAYRGENGNKCFVGALIPDELYCSSIEGRSAHYAIQELNLLDSFENVYFLSTIQSVHDNNFNDREEQLKNIAKIYNLTYTPPTQN